MGFADEQPEQGGDYGGDAGAIVGLLQLGGGLYNSYQDRKTAKRNTDATNAANKAEAELAYQRSVEQWNRQNMYNTPEAQMARFKAGGLNPNLIYGQGNSGNASAPPQYQPANMQYRYESGDFGTPIAALLPTLMSVGTWMQNMRLTEQELEKKSTDTDRAKQMIEYLQNANPEMLRSLSNKNELFPYQRNIQRIAADQAQEKLFEFETEYRHKYGDELFENMGSAFTGEKKPIGGMKRLQFLQENSKTKLLDAKSSWTDMNITDPQAIMQMVMQGVLGLAGQTMRLSTHRNPAKANSSTRSSGERPLRSIRNHPADRQRRR